MSDKIGDKTCLLKCEDCSQFFHFLEGNRYCEDCFEKGLHKDMNEHWDNYWKEEPELEVRLKRIFEVE